MSSQYNEVGNDLHVVHVVFSFSVGGLERIIANCIDSMPSNIKHTVIALTRADSEFVSTISSSIEVIELNKPPGQSFATLWQALKIINALKPDVLHTYNLACLQYQFLGALCGVNVRLHAEHGRDLADPKGENVKYRWWRRIFSRFTHYHVCVSDDLYQWLTSIVKIPTKRARLIRNGVDTEIYHKSLEEETSQTTRKKIFGHVARLDGIKNQANLITGYILACNLSDAFMTQTKLVIVGDGPERNNLMAQIQQVPDSIDIEMWGLKSDMIKVYQQFDAFVLSSDAEGIPMTILEAMACQLPILSTRVGGIPEIVDKQYGVLCDAKSSAALSEGFLSMFNQCDDWQNMGDCARKRVQQEFSQASMNQQYLSLYIKRT